jgi:hypothetical protein
VDEVSAPAAARGDEDGMDSVEVACGLLPRWGGKKRAAIVFGDREREGRRRARRLFPGLIFLEAFTCIP